MHEQRLPSPEIRMRLHCLTPLRVCDKAQQTHTDENWRREGLSAVHPGLQPFGRAAHDQTGVLPVCRTRVRLFIEGSKPSIRHQNEKSPHEASFFRFGGERGIVVRPSMAGHLDRWSRLLRCAPQTKSASCRFVEPGVFRSRVRGVSIRQIQKTRLRGPLGSGGERGIRTLDTR